MRTTTAENVYDNKCVFGIQVCNSNTNTQTHNIQLPSIYWLRGSRHALHKQRLKLNNLLRISIRVIEVIVKISARCIHHGNPGPKRHRVGQHTHMLVTFSLKCLQQAISHTCNYREFITWKFTLLCSCSESVMKVPNIPEYECSTRIWQRGRIKKSYPGEQIVH